MRVLGIESSCDETGVAIFDSEGGLLAHVLHSQIALHQQYGGVVPELASRDHVRQLVPLVDQALIEARLNSEQLDAIAYTAGPGLTGALLTGACFAKSLAMAWGLPAIAVHHLEAHLLAAQLENSRLAFPFLALLVSGGHTQLIEASALGQYRLLGESLDDAAGEAFDKTAKLMGLPYPGGALLAKLAESYDPRTCPAFPAFPRPMTDRPGLDFSFSGLKTHALHVWNQSEQDEPARIAIAHAFQRAVVDTLIIKCQRAQLETAADTLVVAGGVGANRLLRTELQAAMQKTGCRVLFPSIEYCTDNGAMVAYTGYLHLLNGERDSSANVEVKPRWPLSN